MIEYWDVFDAGRRKTGRTHRRGFPLKNGEYHLVVDIIVINRDGRLLIDRRSPHKRNCPDYWEFTSGSVVSGESSIGGALRELSEEVGIYSDADSLSFIGSTRAEHRFVDTYMLVTDVDVEKLTLQEEEVAEAKLVTLEELDEICKTQKTWCRRALNDHRSAIESAVYTARQLDRLTR